MAPRMNPLSIFFALYLAIIFLGPSSKCAPNTYEGGFPFKGEIKTKLSISANFGEFWGKSLVT